MYHSFFYASGLKQKAIREVVEWLVKALVLGADNTNFPKPSITLAGLKSLANACVRAPVVAVGAKKKLVMVSTCDTCSEKEVVFVFLWIKEIVGMRLCSINEKKISSADTDIKSVVPICILTSECKV